MLNSARNYARRVRENVGLLQFVTHNCTIHGARLMRVVFFPTGHAETVCLACLRRIQGVTSACSHCRVPRRLPAVLQTAVDLNGKGRGDG